MPHLDDPLHLQTYIEFDAGPSPDIARTGKARLWWDQANGVFKLSVSGGAYAEVPSLIAGGLSAADMLTALASASILNAHLATPKVVAYQQTVLFSQLTDGAGASGTLALSHTIPAGAVYLRTLITAITGWTGGASAVMILGDGTDTDRYNTGTPDLFTTAAQGVDAGAPSGTAWHTTAKTPVLTVTEAADFGLITAGAVTLTLFYYSP